MEIVYDEPSLDRYMAEAVEASPEHPILIDKFLEDAIEVDVDAVCDGVRTIVGGVMEHIEEAGIHSGDSACAIPPFSLRRTIVAELKEQTYALAEALEGARSDEHPVCRQGWRDLRPGGQPAGLADRAVRLEGDRAEPGAGGGAGHGGPDRSKSKGSPAEPVPQYVSVKEAVFPFAKFPGVDIVLGPEMRSTGEVMGIAMDFPAAFAKSQLAALSRLPASGTVFVSVAARDRKAVVPIARRLAAMGFRLLCTGGTAQALSEQGIDVEIVRKIHEGRPNVLDYLANGTIDLIVNTPSGKGARTDEGRIRAAPSRTACPASPPSPARERPSPPWNGSARERWRSMRSRIC